jgi:endoglucanase
MKNFHNVRSLLFCFSLLVPTALQAQGVIAPGTLAPSEISGKAVYIPYPVTISLDGKLDDWANIPLQCVDRGPAVSKAPAKNGSFQFAVAADEDNLYVLMLAKDNNIIANLHGADTWNEDSMEFYINLSGNLNAKKYSRDIVQYRVTPADIDNADLTKLKVSGSNFDLHPLKAKVFKTEDGWGFEGAVKLDPKFIPAHGKEIGFQAQLNGASVKDRDVKLIWSLADTSDNSWQNPNLFGRALFFKVGSVDVPKPSEAAPAPAPVAVAEPVAPALSMNQIGYFPNGKKIISLAGFGEDSLQWTLVDATSKKEVTGGMTRADAFDFLSGDRLHVADFSSFTTPGDYYLIIGGTQGPVFHIGDDIMKNLSADSLMYFYRSRSGIEIKPEYAGKTWARDAGHLSDAKVAVFDGKDAQGKKWDTYDFFVNGSGGWYDAGDFGKYVVNGGISVWTLQNAYERNPGHFKDGQLTTPESGNTYPDILDEARWELEFMLNMQIPEGSLLAGMCFHKLHDRTWSAMPSALPTSMDNNLERKDGCSWGRFVYEPSTAATLNLAACAAQASRLWAPMDPSFSKKCLGAAQTAWKAALDHPSIFAGNIPGDGGGNYDDGDVSDEFFWAAAELFATTGEGEYLQFLKASPYWKNFPGLEAKKANAMNWADTAALGTLTLVSAPSKLDKTDRAFLEAQIVATADRYLSDAQSGGYGVPMESAGYVWGSNSGVLNNAIILAVAYDATKETEYRDTVVQAMNYLLGYNGLHKSFITGYGVYPVSHPHHRVWANDPDSGYIAPPPGVLAGGPNKNIEDPEMKSAHLSGVPIAKRYIDTIGSFATNEVAINWNAPLAWVSNWLDSQYEGR